MLADEYGTASNIKSRVNRLSVLSAITATQQRLKLYNKGLLSFVSKSFLNNFVSPAKGSSRILWYDYDRRGQGEESDH